MSSHKERENRNRFEVALRELKVSYQTHAIQTPLGPEIVIMVSSIHFFPMRASDPTEEAKDD